MQSRINEGPATAATVDRPRSYSSEHQIGNRSSTVWQGLADPSANELNWRTSHGVQPSTIVEPWLIRSAYAVYDGLRGFDLQDGNPALIFKVENCADEHKRHSLSPAVRHLIFDCDGHQSLYCGAVNGPHEVDHIIPVSKGGSNDSHNLTPWLASPTTDLRARGRSRHGCNE
jgi:hypothetical protein